MSSSPSTYGVYVALLAALRGELDEHVSSGPEEHAIPAANGAGWVTVDPLPGGGSVIVLAGESRTMDLIYQITSKGVQVEQALGVSDAVCNAMLDRTSDGGWRVPITGSGFTVIDRGLYYGQRQGVLRSPQGPDFVFSAPDRYRLTVTID